MSRLNRLLLDTSRAMFAAGGVLLALMLVITLTNILARGLFGYSFRGVVEISGFLCAAAIGLSLPLAQIRGCHVAAGLLEERLPAAWIRAQQALTAAACVFFLGVTATEMVSLGLFVLDVDERIDGWNFSYYGLVFALAAGCVVQALVLVAELIRLLSGRGETRAGEIRAEERGESGVGTLRAGEMLS